MENNSRLANANKNTLKVSLLFTVIIDIGLISSMFFSSSQLIALIVIGCFLNVSMVLSFLSYRKNKTTNLVIVFTGLAFIVPWVLAMFFTNNVFVYTLQMPIIAMYGLYANRKITGVTISICGATQVLSTIMEFVNNAPKMERPVEYVTVYAIVIVYYIVMFGVTTIISKSFQEASINLERAEVESNKQQQLVEKILNTVEKISENSITINDIVEEIAKSSEVVGNAVQEIAAGASKTAEDMQDQSTSVDSIQNEIENSVKLCDEMNEASTKASKVIDIGVETVQQLSQESKIVTEDSNEVSKLMGELKDKCTEIEDITSLISDIAGQTNLLALNASIEAARAGEAGRGFSVVAAEVGNLAEQCKEATININSIVGELQDRAGKSSDMVDKLTKSNYKQNGLVNDTKEAFDNIRNNVENIVSRTEIVKRSIDDIFSSNENIVQNISSISAISQETMANTEETFAMAEKHISDAKQAMKLVEELMEASNSLKEV